MMRSKLFVILFSATASLSCLAQGGERVAVVVSPQNSVTNISLIKVREIYRCDKLSWPSGAKLAIFTRAVGTPEHSAMLRVLGMQDGDFKQFYVMKQMRGEVECRVTELPSKGMLLEMIRSYPGAIGLIRVSDVLPTMKVISVDGKKVDDPGYPLQ